MTKLKFELLCSSSFWQNNRSPAELLEQDVLELIYVILLWPLMFLTSNSKLASSSIKHFET